MLATIILWSHALAALLFAALALGQLRRAGDAVPRLAFTAALACTALWVLAVAGIGPRDVAARLAHPDLARAVEGGARRHHHVRAVEGRDHGLDARHFHVHRPARRQARAQVLLQGGVGLVHQLHLLVGQDHEAQLVAVGDLDALDVALQIFADDALGSGQLRVLLPDTEDPDLIPPPLADVRVI